MRSIANAWSKASSWARRPRLPGSPAYEAAKNTTYAFDLDKAKSLLNQAGVSNLSLYFLYTAATPEYAQMGEIYNSDLAKIGVTLNLNPHNSPDARRHPETNVQRPVHPQ